MITVTILINGQPIYTRTAVNVSTDSVSGDLNIYESDDGSIISHNKSHGAIVLAKKLLDTIKEQK